MTSVKIFSKYISSSSVLVFFPGFDGTMSQYFAYTFGLFFIRFGVHKYFDPM